MALILLWRDRREPVSSTNAVARASRDAVSTGQDRALTLGAKKRWPDAGRYRAVLRTAGTPSLPARLGNYFMARNG